MLTATMGCEMVLEASNRSRWVQLFWAMFFYFIFVGSYWEFGNDLENFGLYYGLILVGMVGINRFYGEGLKEIGLWPKNFKTAFSEFGLLLLCIILILLCFGLLFGQYHFPKSSSWLSYFLIYCFSGLLQQYLLNGFFLNRLVGFVGDERNPRIPIIAGGFFAMAHIPNWFLVVITFFAGWVCCAIFLRPIGGRNLYFLGLAHGIIGFLLLAFLPHSISQGFRIGLKLF